MLTSGFSEQEVVDDLLNRHATVFMQKPFSAQELVERLCAMIGG